MYVEFGKDKLLMSRILFQYSGNPSMTALSRDASLPESENVSKCQQMSEPLHKNMHLLAPLLESRLESRLEILGSLYALLLERLSREALEVLEVLEDRLC